MADGRERDHITVEDENGVQKQFAVEALFDMEDSSYALLKPEEDDNDTIVMQVKNEEDGQYLISIDDPDKKEMILDAYEIAVDANPAD
ncbi:DUF1292 domain-containing protein [Pseudalkalibacillus salsuginis]|uniref:DUF1292 domain-containing protein n=1 Tax=Pseudalkalibacillus salsuginis TaxID=2910972 RepID=UPI001F330ACC|nr:DUF1292 domain-containing protein [Pseudalkalibacillus salsuginis]MCF6410288.1 DUF1292 domain-containing protein [Pseudalkalibacillus salsuginis]